MSTSSTTLSPGIPSNEIKAKRLLSSCEDVVKHLDLIGASSLPPSLSSVKYHFKSTSLIVSLFLVFD